MSETRAAISEATRYDRVWMTLLSVNGVGLEVVGYLLPNEEMVHQRVATLRIDTDPFLSMLFTAEEAAVVPDMREHPLADQGQVEFFGNRTMIYVPMLRLGERVGVLAVGTFAAQGIMEPTSEEYEFIVQIGSLVSAATGRLEAEKNQRELEGKMRSAQRMESLGRLAGEVSHDINNILVCITGNTELANMEMGRDHAASELLEEVLQASSRAAALTRQLLAFSKGQLLERKNIDVTNVIQQLARMLARLLPDNIELVLELAPDVRAVMDQGQLEQLMMNLVLNSRDAMQRGGELRVVVQPYILPADVVVQGHQPGDSLLRISVADQGEGMSEEVRAHIFEPFFTTKAVGKGTGLGMSVVDNVAKEYGGFAKVQSALGKGTTVEVFLPAANDPEEIAAVAEVQTGRAQGQQILVVDDDQHICLYLKRLLEQTGYVVLLANHGAEALELLEEHPEVSLVLSDLMMPVLDGKELARELKTRPSAPPILLMTGYAVRASELESEQWVAKPFASKVLLAKIRELLDAAAQARAPAV